MIVCLALEERPLRASVLCSGLTFIDIKGEPQGCRTSLYEIPATEC
jgi:hypothetical protein